MGGENTGTFIVLLVQAAVFLTPVLIVFYRQGLKDQRVNELEKDVNGIGKKVAVMRDTQASALAELNRKVDCVEKSIVGMETSMKFIAENLKELRR
jgi:chaperonin cofactor prefoldin